MLPDSAADPPRDEPDVLPSDDGEARPAPAARAAEEELATRLETLLPRRPTRLGPYEVLGEVGRGGMGTVYKVRHVELESVRAVKVVSRASSTRALKRFEREAHNLARVVHPGVARVHETGEADGCRWFAMEYVEGEPLHRVLARERLPLGRALELARGIAEGVAALHEVGVIHRDLKPSNVVVSRDGRPVVLDLGLAVAPEFNVRLTSTGATLGTIQYMAPEQFHGAASVTTRTDVYALGALLFELVTGHPAVPRSAGTPALAAKIITEDRPRPSAFDPELPAALDELCARALARDPARRPPDAGALAAELRALQEDLGPTARVVRRRRLLTGGAAAAALLAVVGGAALAALSREGPDAPPLGEPAPVASAPGGDPTRAARGASELERLALRGPEGRLADLDGWLARYPDHPARARAERLREESLLHVPLRVLRHPECHDAAFLADGRVVTVGADRLVRVWDLERSEPLLVIDAGWPVRALAVAPDGVRFAYAGDSREVVWVDPAGARHALRRAGQGPASAIAFARDGHALAVGGRQPEVFVYAFPSGEVLHRFDGHRDVVRALDFSADGRTLAVGGGRSLEDPPPHDNAVRLWSLEGGPGPALRQRVTLWAMANDLAYAPSGRLLAVACDGTKIRLFDGHRGEALGELLGAETAEDPFAPRSAHFGIASGLAFAPGGELLAAVSHTRDELRVWRLPAQEEVFRRARPIPPWRVRFARHGARLALVSGRADRVEVWDLAALTR